MARTNYSFAKRQRELAKKQQRDAKRERKAAQQPPAQRDHDVASAPDPAATGSSRSPHGVPETASVLKVAMDRAWFAARTLDG